MSCERPRRDGTPILKYGNEHPTHLVRRRRFCLAAIACAWIVSVSGCQGHRPSWTRNGSLKAGMSQVQFENDTLKAQVSKLEKQNRELLADLQREESHAGTLAARLDESRNLLRSRGVNVPLEIDNPRIVARSEAADSATRTTFGEVRPSPRRSRYVSEEKNGQETEIPENEPARAKAKTKSGSSGDQPPGFPDDPPSMEKFGDEVPELSSNDLSTGWRRLSYRDLRETERPAPRR